MRISKIMAVTALGLFLAACKIEVIVPEGGAVKSESGTYECEAGKTCEVLVSDLFFDEVFVAHPADGMHFTGWKKRDRGFCGGNTEPCALYTSGFEGQDHLMRFLDDAEEVFYLEATFAEGSGSASVACEFLQSTPGGEFEACVVAPDLTAESCQEIADDTFGGTAEITSTDCAGSGPEGLCSTPIGDFYYSDLGGRDFASGCSFMAGEWTDL